MKGSLAPLGMTVVLAGVVFASAPHQPPPPAECWPDGTPGRPDPHMYCVALIPAAAAPAASGAVALGQARSPFGVAVTADGRQIYDATVTISGLPPVASLGPYSAYVAWVTTPHLSPMLKLGQVANGRTSLGRVDLNQFLILITAERSATGSERAGRIVLRGMSPSTFLHPQDPTQLPPRSLPPSDPHASHDPGTGGAPRWAMPPMHPAVSAMIPNLERLVPAVRPYLPGSGLDPATIPEARPSAPVDLEDGDTLVLEAGLIRRTVRGRSFIMYSFNGSSPGPLIRVRQRATVTVQFRNRLDRPTAVHWHGVRLDNAFDGVPGLTQPPVAPGDSFWYQVRLPDAGVYWYHPHQREDIQQDLGLYGNLLVRPERAGHFAPVDREAVLLLDDLLVGQGGPLPYGDEAATHALMGRFGNFFLVNGEPDYRLEMRPRQTVRLFLTNVSNVRTFNLSLPGIRLKLVGSDLGRFEREEWVQSVVIAPAERYIVEARFERAGAVPLLNRVQAIDHAGGRFFAETDTLGHVVVTGPAAGADGARPFDRLRRHRDITAELKRYRSHLGRPPDHELHLTLRVGQKPNALPFGLVQALRADSLFVNPVEWSGTMPMMDWLSTARQVEWVLRDPASGTENMAIDWRFRRGEVVKLRLVNDRHTLHAMQHPIHVHGQRFLVLARNGLPNDNLVWKDTVLLPAGATADLLLEPTNPGRWMIHCHIAEHLEAGMHAVFTVE